MMQFMNLVTSWDWKSGSGMTSRLATTFLLGMVFQRFLRAAPWRPNPLASGFLPLGSIFRPAFLPPFHAHGIQRAPHDVVSNSRQILDPASPDEHDGMLLEIVPHSGNVGRDLDAVGQSHAGHLAQGRVGFLGRGSENTH